MTTITSVSGGPLMVDAVFRRSYLGEQRVLARRHVPRLREANIHACVLPVDTLDEFRHFIKELEESDGEIKEIDSADQLEAVSDESTGFILCGNYQTIGDNADNIALFHQLGMRMFSLTLNRRNLLADGCSERAATGLSYFGIDVVHELAERNIMIDVSHASEKSFWDVLEAVDVPIIASHSNAQQVCQHARNLSDDQLRALAERDGLIGLSMHPTMVAPEDPTAEHVIDHLDYMVDLIGIDHIAIATDYIDYVIDFFRHKLASGDPSGTLYNRHEHTYPKGIETVTKVSRLQEIMTNRGYTASDIHKISWANFKRYWAAVENQI